ncbi:MAG: hypothetical protein ACOX3T_01025 [Bdellovibrionota bacterium]
MNKKRNYKKIIFIALSFFISLSFYADKSYSDELPSKATHKENSLKKGTLLAKNIKIAKNIKNDKKTRSDSPSLQGKIDLAEEKKGVLPWVKGQSEIKLVLDGFVQDAQNGKIDNYIPDLGKEALEQLAATYLFCSKLQGPCKFILDTLLELELARSIKNNDVSCSGLKQFWKIWLDNNYDKQLNFDMKLGLMEKNKMFQTYDMPKYIHCEETIRKDFKKDYIPSKEALANIKKTSKLVALLGKKYGDISSQYILENTAK